MNLRRMLLAAAVAAVGIAGAALAQNAQDRNLVKISGCLVTLVEEVEVPAREAGQLVDVEAKEGQSVEAGSLLARIDDDQVRNAMRVAANEQRAAHEQAVNDVNVRYSVKAAEVAQAEYEQAIDANRRKSGAISDTELRRRKLAQQRAELQIEQAEMEQRVAVMTDESKQAEVDLAQLAIDRRQIVAPITGIVVEVMKHRGEWVQPGDSVLRIVRIDHLRVEGFLDAAEIGPEEVSNKPVTIEVQLARGRVERFQGKIVFVDPRVEAGGLYHVRAEVVNRAENGQWLLRPGLAAELSIHLDGAADLPLDAARARPPARNADAARPFSRRGRAQ